MRATSASTCGSSPCRRSGDALTQYAVALGVAAVMYFSFSDLERAAFLGFITAMGMLLAPLKRLININAVVQRGIAAGAELFEILDEPGESRIRARRRSARARGDVEYRDVSFRYDADKEPALRDVSLDVPAGTTRCARRPVGQRQVDAREPAAALLRCRQRAPCCSTARTCASYTLRDLRRQIALVSQDVVLFDDTIANNIAYGALASSSRADDRARRRGGVRREFAAALAARARHARRRARRAALGRPAPADRDRARAAEGRARADPRRGDVGARHRIRAPHPGRARRDSCRVARRSSSRIACRPIEKADRIVVHARRRDRRDGHARGAARARRLLRLAAQDAVRGVGRSARPAAAAAESHLVRQQPAALGAVARLAPSTARSRGCGAPPIAAAGARRSSCRCRSSSSATSASAAPARRRS